MSLLQTLSYPPIARGLVVLLIAGLSFPLVGVFVLRLHLVTLRFTLMHGTMLGAALGLAAGADPVLSAAAVNVGIVAILASPGRRSSTATGTLATFLMVTSIGLAFLVIYRFNVPAKDTLAILWGSLFALTPADAWLVAGFAAVIVGLVIGLFPSLRALLFSDEIAFSAGVNTPVLRGVVLVLVGLTVALAVRLVGALLLDALLLLPAIVAVSHAKSTRELFVLASGVGLTAAAGGFALSLALDVPASSAVTLVAGALLGLGYLFRRRPR
jgi:zinc transport system permease protein